MVAYLSDQRQRQILNLLVLNFYSDKEIGNALNLTEGTVKQYMCFLRSKYGAKNRIALAIAYHAQLAKEASDAKCGVPIIVT